MGGSYSIPTIPKWSVSLLSAEEVQGLSKLVGEVESQTEGEIVPLLVKTSTPRVLFRYFIFLILLSILFLIELPEHQKWVDSGFIWVMPVLAVAVFLISKPLSASAVILRFFYPSEELIENVERRALLEFHLNGIKNTRNRTGILIFVSYDEKKVVILGDQAISSKLPKETWQKICRQMVEHLKKGAIEASFREAIVNCGDLLKAHFPASQQNPNELSNQFLIQ